MIETGKERFILTKSYEIAYAMFRTAAQIEEKDFSERLRSLGGSLLQAAAGQDYAAASKSLQMIECMAKFAGDVNIISSANSDILLGEIYTLDAAIIEYRNAANNDRLNLSDIFSRTEPEVTPPPVMYDRPTTDNPAMDIAASINPATGDAANEAIAEGEVTTSTHDSPTYEKAANSVSAEIRQSTIVERIRQSGNCRLKDIRELLPDTSERTIRYDLQSLLEKHLIERVGEGGPSVFYRMREVREPAQG